MSTAPSSQAQQIASVGSSASSTPPVLKPTGVKCICCGFELKVDKSVKCSARDSAIQAGWVRDNMFWECVDCYKSCSDESLKTSPTKKRKHDELQELRDDLRKSEAKKARYIRDMLHNGNAMLAYKKELERLTGQPVWCDKGHVRYGQITLAPVDAKPLPTYKSLNRIISDLQAKNQALHQTLKSERKLLYASSAYAKASDTVGGKIQLRNAIARLNLSPGSTWKDVTDADMAEYKARESTRESKPKPLEDSAFAYATSLFRVANNELTFEQLEEEQGK